MEARDPGPAPVSPACPPRLKPHFRGSVRLLLDTSALLWWLAGEGLTVQARDAIADPENLVVVSAVSAWEISIKKALGKACGAG
jgi:hypothetical protein